MLLEDVGFARKQIVGDADPAHRRDVLRDDRRGDLLGRGGAEVAPFLHRVERLRPKALRLRPLLVFAPHVRVHVPAEVAERSISRPARIGAPDRAVDLLQRPPPDVEEADDHVGDLNARVVDVVLHLDRAAGVAEAPHEGVAEHRVAKVADVRGFVGVDVRVLDDDLAGPGRQLRGRRGTGPEHPGDERAPVEPEIQVAGSLDGRRRDAGREDDGPGELGRDRARGFPEALREVERDGRGEVSLRDIRRPFEGEFRVGDAEGALEGASNGIREALADGGGDRGGVQSARSLAREER